MLFGKLLYRLALASLAVMAVALGGCDEDPYAAGELELTWGRHGISDGRLFKPRAMAIDEEDHLYIVDMTARIQVFDRDGNFLRSWKTPAHEAGRPTGLSMDRDGNLLVADTHYFRVLVYSKEGELLRTLGGTQGDQPGEFGLVTDCVQDSQGNYYVSQYGEFDRIQKFSREGEFLLQWGGHGAELGSFVRPQSMFIDEQDHLWVTDACNHRVQCFDSQGNLLLNWGQEGDGLGQLRYPYGITVDEDGNFLLVEYGNHRLQRFTRDGKSLGCWGSVGRGEGQLYNPWAVVVDSQGAIHVLDTGNHRVHRLRM